MQILYSIHKLLFMFNNATCYSIYIKNSLQIAYINKKLKN